MGHYDAQQVCLNGHQITDRYGIFPEVGWLERPKSCGREVTRAMRFLRSPHPTRATIFADTIDGGMTAEYVMLFLITVLRDRTLSCFE